MCANLGEGEEQMLIRDRRDTSPDIPNDRERRQMKAKNNRQNDKLIGPGISSGCFEICEKFVTKTIGIKSFRY